MNTETIVSKTADGSEYHIGLTQTDKDKGILSIRQFKGGKEVKHDNFNVYNIVYVTGQLGCYANVFGNDPWVTFHFAPTSIIVTITGAMIGNGTTIYPTDSANLTKLETFITKCAFPKPH